MATVINPKDTILQAASPRLESVLMPSSFNISGDLSGTILTVPVATVLSDIDYATSGDATVDILENSGTTIVVTSSTLFKTTASGDAGVFIGAGGIFAKDASANTTFSLDGSTGSGTYAGDLVTDGNVVASGTNQSVVTINVGGSNYDIDYSVYGKGETDASASNKVRAGLLGRATATTSQFNVGVVGLGSANSKGIGVVGEGGLYGVMGNSSDSANPGVYATNTNAGGLALLVNGKMEINDSTKVENLNAEQWNGHTIAASAAAGATTVTQDLTNKPGASTTANTWLEIVIGGTSYVFPVWAK